jgi:transcriptional regulator of arginine metabolism
MKDRRQAAIRALISECEIETQEELIVKLRERGFTATQATVSRDIGELRLLKVPGSGGRPKYAFSDSASGGEAQPKYSAILQESIIRIDCAGHIVAIKCHNGMANAACAAIDATEFQGVVGSLAGDDTIFILMRSTELAERFIAALRKMIKR